MDEPAISHPDENEENVCYVLDEGYLLEAVRLSASLTSRDSGQNIVQHLVVRVPAPDAVLQACIDLFFKDHQRFSNLVLRNFGNPEPYTDEMGSVLNWTRLLRLSRNIDVRILREQSVNLDQDVLYSEKGYALVRDAGIDSRDRQRIEANFSGGYGDAPRSRYWSPTTYIIRQYFENSRSLNGLSEEEIQGIQTNWGILRTVAAVGGILEKDVVELFARATFDPYPLFIPYSEEETWEWFCQELDSLDEVEKQIDEMKERSIREGIEDLRREAISLPAEERLKREQMMQKLEIFLNNPEDLAVEDRSVIEDIIEATRKDIYRLIQSEAYKLDIENTGGETVPLAQMLEFEAENAYQAAFSWILQEIYLQLRSQMTRAERRLFLMLYIRNPYTAFRVPFLDQTVRDFFSSASEDVIGIALFVLSGIKKVGKVDLANLFTEYWKTWLWICDLVRSQSVERIAEVLKEQPSEKHQYQGGPTIEISLEDDGIGDWVESMAVLDGVSPIFRDERIIADKLNVEAEALRRIIGDYPAILTRLINQYASPLQKEVLYLKYLSNGVHEPTQREIAQQLGISQAAVSQRIQTGIRAIWHGMMEEEEAGLVEWNEIIECR